MSQLHLQQHYLDEHCQSQHGEQAQQYSIVRWCGWESTQDLAWFLVFCPFFYHPAVRNEENRVGLALRPPTSAASSGITIGLTVGYRNAIALSSRYLMPTLKLDGVDWTDCQLATHFQLGLCGQEHPLCDVALQKSGPLQIVGYTSFVI